MTSIHRNALFPNAAPTVYALVNDIEAYPQFMDGCVNSRILRRDTHVIEARLDLARGAIKGSFTTRNHLVEFSSITMELLDGPFEDFSGRWTFQELGDTACKVSLDMDFTVSNRILGVAAARLFDSVAGNLVDAVSRRARLVLE
ncbi:MAG: ribosome-associated toxin RatA of RatAB toxin-antitoxin module [Halieaceae bacterium]|jgi:ribosome-associated toxin RatA of RatAB toxin-antitoxin module